MLGIDARLESDGRKIVPAERYGIRVVSMGFLTDATAPIIWRGPMLHGVVRQFFQDVKWGELDYLVVDMPPGTGDVALSLSPDRTGHGGGGGDDAAGGLVVRQPPRRRHVPQAERPDARHRREHELLRLLGLRAGERPVRARRRRARRRGARRAFPRRHPAPCADPRRRRYRGADRERRSRIAGGAGLPPDRRACRRTDFDPELPAAAAGRRACHGRRAEPGFGADRRSVSAVVAPPRSSARSGPAARPPWSRRRQFSSR